MLHTIDDTGMISWHCHNPRCKYHNCSKWESGIQCTHHGDTQRGQPAGETLTAHLSDPGVHWTDENNIALPPCPECGTQMTLHVHDDEELTPPIITKDERTGKILQVAPADHPKYSPNLWLTNVDITRKQNPHPTLAHLEPDQIIQMQADLRNKAPDAPVDWMLSESIQAEIKSVEQHPAVARHAELARQLKETGKVYQEPATPEAQQLFTLDQVKELITSTLQEHGVITSPRLPTVNPNNPS